MSDLPKGWTETTLNEVGNWSSGGTPSRKNTDYFGQGFYWIKSGDLTDGEIKKTDEQITEEGLKNSSAKLMPSGTISVALYGATIGKLGIMTFPATTNQACANVIPNSNLIDTKFLFYYLYSEKKNLIEKGQGGAQPNISQEVLKVHPVVIAPLNEQKRIVEKLEKLLGKVEAVQARLDKIPAILKRFRQAVLAAACSGKLTADWRLENQNLETATEIIKNLKNLRLANAKNLAEKEKITAIYDFVEEADSLDLPESWRFAVLNKICNSYTYGTSTKSDKEGLVAVLRMGNIQSGKLDWTDLVYTSDKSEIGKYRLKPNSVLFNRTNSPELVGKTAIYRGEQEAIFAGYLIRINNFDCLDSEYLNCCLNTTFARDFCLQVKTDGVSQSNINAQKLGLFELAMPPIEEQKEIVRRVEDLFKFADQIEDRYKKARSYTNKLTQSILAKAFRGELVPQDETDEPASVLLERIKAEKTENNNGKTKSKPKQKAANQSRLFE